MRPDWLTQMNERKKDKGELNPRDPMNYRARGSVEGQSTRSRYTDESIEGRKKKTEE